MELSSPRAGVGEPGWETHMLGVPWAWWIELTANAGLPSTSSV